jgi:hypothetical protein
MHVFLVYLPFDPDFLTRASWRSGVSWHKLVQWSELMHDYLADA